MRLDDMVYAAVFVIAVVGFSTAGYQLGNKRGHERGVQESLGITARSVDCARAGVTMGFIEATEALGLDLVGNPKAVDVFNKEAATVNSCINTKKEAEAGVLAILDTHKQAAVPGADRGTRL